MLPENQHCYSVEDAVATVMRDCTWCWCNSLTSQTNMVVHTLVTSTWLICVAVRADQSSIT